jgi:hypothetical protein
VHLTWHGISTNLRIFHTGRATFAVAPIKPILLLPPSTLLNKDNYDKNLEISRFYGLIKRNTSIIYEIASLRSTDSKRN